ncbi:UNVERIFIED_ORG: hypothetical protein GGI57_004710 [Rhizobium aethiopicum]|uniref:hypothetical protein n=1 Tax=unclassified Rhizobium TaxID=2613769 RepID=UPI0008D954DF|nr:MULTISPECIES: hypothetical protein [unclassified Rhizobium]OHV18825.1 hypothetical protein BBJ66_18820 [Rhizobium sp. RSm-3]RVU10460.1 hypothetical protein EOS93_13855 [Rhizobium sp. RMa-01]
MTNTDAQPLRTFIADENQAFADRRQGKFWPANHHRIGPLATKASGLLDRDEQVDFYFHFMRVAGGAPLVGEKEMPLLLEAYRRMLPFLDLGGVISMPRRHKLLFVFGFDDAGILPSGETISAKALKARLKLITQVGAYTTMPAQRDKKAKFLPFADEAVRILETLRHLGYRHDRRYGEDLYDVTNLSFWGMVFICLLNKATRADLVADMVEGKYDLMRRVEQLAMLHRYVDAVLPDAGPDEERFASLARQLKEIEFARRNATESVALVQELGLPFGDDEDWEIHIAIPLRGTEGHPLVARNVVRLHIRPNPDWQWELNARLAERGEFSEDEKKIYRNDLHFPVLGRGNLRAFPAWLRQVREKNGLDFDTGAADIRVGRKRAAAKLVAQWMGN